MSDFLVRPIVPDDVAFVLASWLDGYWPDCLCSLVMPKSQWWPRWHCVVENILADERTRTVVACNPDDQTQLYGFACAMPPDVLHWCYVKQAFRGNGIATALWPAVGVIPPSMGPVWSSHWSHAVMRWPVRYDPRIIKEYQP